MRRLLRWTAALVASTAAAVVVWCLIPLEPTVPAIRPRSDTQYWSMSRGYRIAFTLVPGSAPVGRPPIVFLHGGPGGHIHSSVISTVGRFAALGQNV